MHNSYFSDAPYHFHQKETNQILLDFNFNCCNCIYCSGNFTFWSSLLFVILFVIQIIIGRGILEFFSILLIPILNSTNTSYQKCVTKKI